MSATRREKRAGNRLAGGDLVITSSTLGNPDFSELLEAATGAGYQGLSLWPLHDYQRAREAGHSAREMRSMVAERGLVAHDVDALVRWVGADDPGWPYLQEAPEALVWEAAAELEVEFVNCILVGEPGRHVVWGLTYSFLESFFRAVDHPLPDRWDEKLQAYARGMLDEGR